LLNGAWLALPGLLVGAAVLALAAAVYLAGSSIPARRLALFLFLWGFQTMLNGSPWLWRIGSPEYLAIQSVFWLVLAASLAAYLWFVSTLDSPFARSIQGVGSVVYWGIIIFILVLILLEDTGFEDRGAGGRVVSAFAAITFLYGVVVAAGAWWRARHSSGRVRARSYFIAAAGHDLLLIPMAIWFGMGSPGASFDQETLVVLFVPAVAALWLAVLLAYGMLRHHVLEIDLKVKWGIGRGTLLAIFVGAFFVSAQVAQEFVVEAHGWLVGSVAAALLLAAIRPLQRFATRVADLALPGVAPTPEYLSLRRAEVYKGAVEEMLADGIMTMKERRALLRLQRDLGLDAALANTIEEDVMIRLEEV
jgi:hypothetical protein